MPPQVSARVTILRNGKVESVDLDLAPALSGVETCMQKALRGMKFRSHDSQRVTVVIPLKIENL